MTYNLRDHVEILRDFLDSRSTLSWYRDTLDWRFDQISRVYSFYIYRNYQNGIRIRVLLMQPSTGETATWSDLNCWSNIYREKFRSCWQLHQMLVHLSAQDYYHICMEVLILYKLERLSDNEKKRTMKKLI